MGQKQGATHHCILILSGRVDNPTAPQHVVNRNNSPRPQQLEQLLIVVIVAGLVSIYEANVKRSLLPVLLCLHREAHQSNVKPVLCPCTMLFMTPAP